MGLIRFLLAITVVAAHSGSIFGLSMVGGRIAVQAFYIISGFYMSLILNEKYINGNGTYWMFLSNRLLRLFPIYWITLGLSFFLGIYAIFFHSQEYATGVAQYFQYFHDLKLGTWIYLVFTNLFLLLQDLTLFLGDNFAVNSSFFNLDANLAPRLESFLLIPQAWTLGVELTFYLIAPFILKKGIKPIVILIVTSLLLRFWLLGHGFNNSLWSYRFFPTEIIFFLAGSMAYRLYVYLKDFKLKRTSLAFIYFGLILFTLFYGYLPSPYSKALYFPVIVIALPFIFNFTKNFKIDSYIGELSYPIYITHIFMLNCILIFKLPHIGGPGLTLVVYTVLFSMVINKLIAHRIEIFRQKRLKSA